jgi:Secretion system C-terminal sorting domain/Photosynthesis system II assembly factor YCF48
MKYIILLALFFCTLNAVAKKQWVQKHYSKTENIETVQCLDSNNCYAFADSLWFLKIYKSSDQGGTWNLIYVQDNEPPRDSVWEIHYCQVVNKNQMYMAYTEKCIIEKSIDGGKSFKRYTFGEYSATDDYIDAFEMYDEYIGVICSNEYIFTTKDGWENYKVFPKGDYDAAGRPIFFIDSNHVSLQKVHWGFGGFKVMNLDNGTWEDYYEGEDPDLWMNMVDIDFISDSVGFVCGGQKTGQGQMEYNIIWKTTDKGRHWEVINNNEGPITGFGLFSIAFGDSLHGLAAASWGVLLETKDGGDTWEYIMPSEKLKNTIGPNVEFAGQYPLIGAGIGGGIFRYEEATDVEEYEDANLKIYQSFDELNIELINKPASNLQFQIVDLLGRGIIRESYENQQNISIDLSQINTGFYMYRIISDGRVLRTGKIIR